METFQGLDEIEYWIQFEDSCVGATEGVMVRVWVKLLDTLAHCK